MAHLGTFDIGDHINYSSFLIFADDLKHFLTVRDISDYANLQQDLYNFLQSAEHNHLDLTFSKHYCVKFYRARCNCLYTCKINNHVIKVRKVLSLLRFIKRLTKDFIANTNSIKLHYFSLVNNHLDYTSTIWNSTQLTHITDRRQYKKKCTL